MSDFERRILNRAQALREEEMRRAVEQTERQRAQAAESAEAQARALRIGKGVVALLEKYQVRPRSIYESRPTGEKRQVRRGWAWNGTEAIDVKGLFKTGEGWHIYSVSRILPEWVNASHVGISQEGNLLDIQGLEGRKHDGNTVKGIVYWSDVAPDAALDILKSDDFENGIASLISTGKPYGRIIDER